MNIRALVIAGVVLAGGVLASAGTAQAQQFTLVRSVIGCGGGPMSGGDNYSVDGTIGQAVIGPTSAGNTTALQGFWYTLQPTGGVHEVGEAAGFALKQNFPNPFNPSTSITFDIPERSKVTIRVLNLLGEEVARVIDQETYDAGEWKVEFNAKDLPSGTYVYRLEAGNFVASKKMVLMK